MALHQPENTLDAGNGVPAGVQADVAPVGDQIADCRARLDQLTEGIVKLLIERAEIVDEIAAYKIKHRTPVHHPSREADILAHVDELARGSALHPTDALSIFKSILAASQAQQGRAILESAQRNTE